MTISTTESTAVFDGNGATTVFPFTFPFYQDSDIKVYQKLIDTGVITEVTTGFSKAGAGSASGGSVTFVAAPAVGVKIIVSRELALTQSTDLRNQGSFFPEVHESAFDRMTAQIQQVAEQVARSVKVDISSDSDPATLVSDLFLAADAASASADAASASEIQAGVSAAAVAAVAGTTVPPNVGNIDSIKSVGKYKFANGVDSGTMPAGMQNASIDIGPFTNAIQRQTVYGVNGASDSVTIATRQVRDTTTFGPWAEIYTSASMRMGYGVTPSAWGADYSSIDAGWGGIAFNKIASLLFLANNCYFDGSNYKYKNAGPANVVTVGALGNALVVGAAASGAANATASMTNYLVIDVNGGVTANSPAGGLGYGAGAGGAVTQATSKATGVTLSKPCGHITMNAAALAASTAVSFTLTNTLIAATDHVYVGIVSGAVSGGSYLVQVDSVSAGSCRVSLRNLTGGSLSEALVLNFQIKKAVTA